MTTEQVMRLVALRKACREMPIDTPASVLIARAQAYRSIWPKWK